MKLIFCSKCFDVFNLTLKEKKCSCGDSGGNYIDKANVKVFGRCSVIGFSNNSLTNAVFNRNSKPTGTEFTAFAIPDNAKSIKWEGKE